MEDDQDIAASLPTSLTVPSQQAVPSQEGTTSYQEEGTADQIYERKRKAKGKAPMTSEDEEEQSIKVIPKTAAQIDHDAEVALKLH